MVWTLIQGIPAAMVKAVYDELEKSEPKNYFTIGIHDDVTHTSLHFDPSFDIELDGVTRALIFGLGADGTVGANKNSIKIIGENTDLHAQGYFVYDSKKLGSQTISHHRFGPDQIRAPYLIQSANYSACHKFDFIYKLELLKEAVVGAVFLLNSLYTAIEVWDRLPHPMQQSILERNIALYVIDATTAALEAGMGRRVNTIMQTCFFAVSGVLPKNDAIHQIKHAIEKSYFTKGRAVDAALDHLHSIELPTSITSEKGLDEVVPPEAPAFVQDVTAVMLRGQGDLLPVISLPVDGTYPSGTSRWEKRNISVWEPDLCIQCGNCSFVCPHSVIRAKFYHESALAGSLGQFPSVEVSVRDFSETRYTLQIYLEDCTGCGLSWRIVRPKAEKTRRSRQST